MIIGISGKIGSGKDTVGMIIQGLTVNPNADLEWIEKFHINSDWQIQKFAGKLKDIVCLLIGCTREQLEDQTFKNTELGPEWNYMEAWRERRYISLDGTGNPQKMTPRKLLQLLGTEAGREVIHPNIWINSLFADYKKITKHRPLTEEERSQFNPAGPQPSVHEFEDFPNWLITDMRFPNEKKAVELHEGITIRVERDTEKRYPKLWQDYTQSNEESWDAFLSHKGLFDNVYHPSEMSLDNEIIWDYLITNNGSIEDLIAEVKSVLLDLKVI